MQKKGSTYSDIHTFANAVSKIEKFLKRAISQNKRYYEPTRLLYIKLAQKLEYCSKLAYQLAGKQVEERPTKQVKPVEVVTGPLKTDIVSEPVFELALSSMNKPAPVLSKPTSTSKQIVGTYLKSCKRLAAGREFAEYEQAVKCGALLCTWIQLRFGTKSTVFHYNAENIKIWIDRFIYAYGYHWRCRLLPKFESDIQDWFTSLRKSDCKYPLPAFIFNMESDEDPEMYCAESLLLERTIKIVIYSEVFYPEQLSTIAAKVLIEHPEYKDLSTDELYTTCVEV